MFDQNQNNFNSSAGNPPSLNSNPNPAPSAQPPRVEDMFQETDGGARPPVFNRPPQDWPAPNAAGYQQDIFGGRSVSQNKIMFFGLIAVAATVMLLVVWLIFSLLNSKQLNINLGQNTNANTNAINNAVLNQNVNNQNAAGVVNESASTSTNTNATVNISAGAPDSDSDGLTDEEEKALGTDPNKWDTDDDSLGDRAEVKIYKTDPLNPDTDGDGFKDGEEVIKNYDPNKGGGARLYEVPK